MRNSSRRCNVALQAVSYWPGRGSCKHDTNVIFSNVKFSSFYHEGALGSYSTHVQFILKRYVTDDHIAILDVEVRNAH